MNASAMEYRLLIAKLGMTQEDAATFLDVRLRTSQRYAASGPPKPVLMLLRLMVRKKAGRFSPHLLRPYNGPE